MQAKHDETNVSEARVVVRLLREADYEAVASIHAAAYSAGGVVTWSRTDFSCSVSRFPEGQIGIELDGTLVATSSALIVDSAALGDQHTYDQACQDGRIDTHDPDGDMLYGFDIAVLPQAQGQRLARRLYDARKELVQARNLRGILLGGRIPGYHRHAKHMSAAEYVRRVLSQELRDPVVSAQQANGFAPRRLLPGYMPSDKESCGYAVLLEWQNPLWFPSEVRKREPRMRVAVVQYEMRTVRSFEEFCTQCEFFIDTAAEYRSDLLLFPELLTNQMLALVPAASPADSSRALNRFTAPYIEFFNTLAISYNVNIVAGTHLTVEDGALYNIAYLFHRDGRIDKQYKIHITPSEARWWGVSGGDSIQVFDTDRGRIGIAICYDIEFPEYARIAKGKGAEVLLVPYNTDIRAAHLRVRACAQARAIENHLYVVTAGAVGNLPQVEGADIHYAQSAILTPSDIAFARDGIAAEATPNVETMLFHDLDLVALRRMEAMGSVRTWKDRRHDLYSILDRRGDLTPTS